MSIEMHPKRIFWLEDNPTFLSFIHSLANAKNIPFSLTSLLERTTFAYDYEMGEEIIHLGQPFDLYILDADIPQLLSEERRREISEYIRGVSLAQDKMPSLEFLTAGRDNPYFTRFWKKILMDKIRDGKAIVFSMNDDAQVDAYELGLPFYSKIHPRSMVENNVRNSCFRKKPVSDESIAAWEHGDAFDLIRNYLALYDASK